MRDKLMTAVSLLCRFHCQIYDRIEEHELKTETDNVTMIEKIVGQMNGKNFMDLAAPHRQFVSKCNVTTVSSSNTTATKTIHPVTKAEHNVTAWLRLHGASAFACVCVCVCVWCSLC